MTDPYLHSVHVNLTHKRAGLRSIGSKQLKTSRNRARGARLAFFFVPFVPFCKKFLRVLCVIPD